MHPAPASDQRARERIRSSLEESLLVEAAAGTGKTTELVRRIVAVLQAGITTVDKVVAVTFTHKAAGELKLRLRLGLDHTRAQASDPAQAAHLRHALAHLEEASIGTIHGFCAQLLRERPVEAGVDPAFGELSEGEADRLRNRAFRSWLEHQLNQDSPALRRALSRLAHRDSWESGSPIEQLRFAARGLLDWRDFPAPWERRPWNREEDIDALVERIRLTAPRLNYANWLRPIHDFATWIERAETLRRRDYDALEALLVKLHRDLRQSTGSRKGVEELLGRLEDFRHRADADFAAALRDELGGFLERYDALKHKSGRLDFLDLLLLARDLVRGQPEVRNYLQQRYSHIFVDEFQDTDPLQSEILMLLAASDPHESDWTRAAPVPGKLFLVGDPKQSIYKFRRADVVLYQGIRDRLTSWGVGLVHLSHSHRSVRSIQQCVNGAFESEMGGDQASGQASYVPLNGDTPDPADQPGIVVLPVPRPYGQRRVSKAAILSSLPDAITAYVAWLIQESGWTVRDPEHRARRIPITPRHVCVLFRRFTQFGEDVTRDYARGLEARGVPHLMVGSRSYHHREEVETLRTALTAVEWPDDELSVYATLRGSLFAFDDALLFRFRHEVSRLHPFAKRGDDVPEEHRPVAEALDSLADLHKLRNWRPVAETVQLLLERCRSHAAFALRPAGHQVLANVYRVADLARSFELGGGISFRGFVEEMEAQAERSEVAEAPVIEEGAEGVRIMTVHTAKGLEFPVVVLADLGANLSARDPERHVDASRGLCASRLLRCAPWELLHNEGVEKQREVAEGVRVAYVAATRARDLLIVPGIGDEPPTESWLAPLQRAVYPNPFHQRRPDPAPGCPKFGDRTVLERPPEVVDRGDDPSVKPGLHKPLNGEHQVVWWDPSLLRLSVEPSLGVRQEEILADGPAAAQSLSDYDAWRAARQDRIEAGSRPKFDLFTPTDGRPLPEGFAPEVGLVSLEHEPGRPTGPRFGSLMHAVLRDIDLDASADAIRTAVDFHARIHGATERESDAAEDAVAKVLACGLVQRARAAERVHREWPVMLPVGGGQLVEGSIDLAFLDSGAWHVVDFKTDEDLTRAASRYRRQVQWYVYAVQKLTGMPATGSLLAV
jgi:ATP-dependent exoDNAse (exonuclease V) beta subunit